MVIVITYQVILRYVFHASNAWSEELARYLFIYDVFIGSAIALRKNSHLQVDVFLNLMKPKTKYLYTIIITILGVAFLVVLFLYSVKLPLAISHPAYKFPWQSLMVVCHWVRY